MTLDFLTLYIVILLNSLTVSVIWAAIAASYRSLEAARYWLASCLIIVVGGAVLAIQGNAGALGPAVVGNGIVIFGFFQMWIGVRRFFGLASGQRIAMALTAASVVCMLIFAGNDRARSIVYAASQAVPMALGIAALLRHRPYASGRYIAAFAMAVGIAGHTTTSISNVMVMTGHMEFEAFYRLASFTLLCTIFSAVVWNFGFAVMTIERLRGEVAALAEHDELTGLPNRRKFNDRMEQEDSRARRSGHGYSLLVIDVDKFKGINDGFGHVAGDRALTHAATILASALRKDDMLARLGGDEFCLLLPETNAEQALEVGRKLADTLRQNPLQWKGQRIAITLSIGVAEWSAEHGNSFEALMTQADAALYRVKDGGRDGIAASQARPRLSLAKG
ncbi:hypothetical protein [Devosia sp. DBB001]|nr:hypothetical protein [Devosia sp. DBB001]